MRLLSSIRRLREAANLTLAALINGYLFTSLYKACVESLAK